MNQGCQAVAVSLHHLEGACSSPQLQPLHLCCFKKAEQGGSELLVVFSEAVTRNWQGGWWKGELVWSWRSACSLTPGCLRDGIVGENTGADLSQGEELLGSPTWPLVGVFELRGLHKEPCRESVCSPGAHRSVLGLRGQWLLSPLGPSVYLPSESLWNPAKWSLV